MHEPPERHVEIPSDLLCLYIQNASAAGALVRKMTFALVFASIIILAGAWNVMPSNWMSARLQMIKAQSENQVLPLADSAATPAETSVSQLDRPAPVNPLETIVQGIILENMLVRVPLFGIVFDVNDLGLFGGLSLIALQVMLYFSMRRKLVNIEMVFRQAQTEGSLLASYRLLAMNQVLITVPLRSITYHTLGQTMPKLLYLPPLMAIGLIASVHVLKFPDIYDFFPSHSISLLVFTLLFGIVILVMVVFSWRLSNREDRLWRCTARTLGILEQKTVGRKR